jgi:starch synthase (maltosyl-transferring)
MQSDDGRRRVVIEGVRPEIDAGRFAIKRTVGERVVVEADAFTDGHDEISLVLRHRHGEEPIWRETPMTGLGNDRWRASFLIERMGAYCYTIEGWVDHFKSWSRDLAKRLAAGQELRVELQVGADLLERAADRAAAADAATATGRERASAGAGDAGRLRAIAADLRADSGAAAEIALSAELAELMARHPDRSVTTSYDRELAVTADPERARFSAWYEFFPRSAAAEPGQHGTFRDAEARLQYAAQMGFDVVYLPPIHPIGRSHRKGRNNAVTAQPGDVGSPWAIGGAEGGHKEINPQLGTLEDFRRFVERGKSLGIAIAMDVAFQCSPDHPYVRQHPEWFRSRPDGTIQYAENPPKKYQDIYPFDFETENWRELWEELKSIFVYWSEQGVHIFRVDNPHTKAFPFWQWCIAEVKRAFPETIFLSEAFTRPKVKYRLAKLGFSQSYNYFPWRNTKWELSQYLTEITQGEVREYFRPNLWPNTPDILPETLQLGGRAAFQSRFVLAATLGASYGIYGPAYELGDNSPREPGSEEYLNSEKYELKRWDVDRNDSLKDLITRVNRVRRENPALQWNQWLRFHETDNDMLICYSKTNPSKSNVVLVVVNLDPHHAQAGWVDLNLAELGLEDAQPFQVHNLLSDARYLWNGARNFVELSPHGVPARIFKVQPRVRTERDFEYFF